MKALQSNYKLKSYKEWNPIFNLLTILKNLFESINQQR